MLIFCRQRLEESNTVQCPSVAYQLAGAKKIQQDLASPETLERFLDSPDEIELARKCFAGLSSPSHTRLMLLLFRRLLCSSDLPDRDKPAWIWHVFAPPLLALPSLGIVTAYKALHTMSWTSKL